MLRIGKSGKCFYYRGEFNFFDLFNLGIVPALIWGLRSVILLEKKGFIYSLFTSLLGVLTFLIHLGFFIFGFKQFNLPISIAIIVLCMLSATIQLLYTLKQKEIFKN
jgi:hypothetical protein